MCLSLSLCLSLLLLLVCLLVTLKRRCTYQPSVNYLIVNKICLSLSLSLKYVYLSLSLISLSLSLSHPLSLSPKGVAACGAVYYTPALRLALCVYVSRCWFASLSPLSLVYVPSFIYLVVNKLLSLSLSLSRRKACHKAKRRVGV